MTRTRIEICSNCIAESVVVVLNFGASMRTTTAFSLALPLILAALVFAAGQTLSPADKDWLETVKPIITRTEREIFLQLRTKADRDKFIAFFWKQRDPRPDTEKNEFYDEYMARIRFADATFHDQTSQRGSRTERGYYYLLLGPPLERNINSTLSQIWPVEVWFYKGDEEHGLPPYFNLMFFQPEGFGPYRLYSPSMDGPERLTTPTSGQMSLTRDSAYRLIKEVTTEVAGASLSYIPGERPLTSSSLSSDTLISQVRSLAEKKFSDGYARSFLDFKDYIETDYSHNYIECNALVRVFRRSGQFFVDWTVEPEKMNFEPIGETIFASYELIVKLEKADGSPLLEKTEEIPLRLTPEQYKTHERQRVAFQDVLPVIAGDSRLFLLLKNKTTKDFMSFQARLSVPGEIPKPRLGDILLYHRRQDLPAAQKNGLQAFALNGRHYDFNARNEFLSSENLGCFVQALRLPDESAAGAATVVFEITAFPRTLSQDAPATAKSPVFSRRFAAGDVLDVRNGAIDVGPFPLAGLPPGYFQASLTILDASGRTILAGKENFIILASPMPVLPWVYARQHPPFPSLETLFLLGSQYFMAGDYGRAKEILDQASVMRDDPRIRLLLGRTLYALGRFQDSIRVTEPLYQSRHGRDEGKVLALDRAGLGDWAAALALCQDLLKGSTEISVLNLAAEALLRLNRPDEALPLLRKSLQLDPNQPAIKAMEEKARIKS